MPDDAKFIRWDGKAVDVAAIHCNACKNYFWAAHCEIQMPAFCPYCGREFDGIQDISNEESNDLQV